MVEHALRILGDHRVRERADLPQVLEEHGHVGLPREVAGRAPQVLQQEAAHPRVVDVLGHGRIGLGPRVVRVQVHAQHGAQQVHELVRGLR
ncbi:Uncharacterised protein [Streptococcus pneumoniae]|nr:Uncharacterised protein [Streptococcus pneumoniae]